MAQDQQPGPSESGFTAYSRVIGAFQAQVIFGLVMRAFGVIYLIILEEFQTSATLASWIGATHTLTAGISCMFVARLCQKYGCRMVAGVGCLFHLAGFMLSAFAKNVYVMYVSFGVMIAIGTACSTTTGFLIVSMTFTKKRALATSLASSGSSMSVLFMPVFVNFLFKYYGFQGCMFILGGICLQSFVSAALYGPHETNKELESTRTSAEQNGHSINHQTNTNKEGNMQVLPQSNKNQGVENKAFDIIEDPTGERRNATSHTSPHPAFDFKESMFDEQLYMPTGQRRSFVDLRVPRRPSKHDENAFDSLEFMFEEEFPAHRFKKRNSLWKSVAELDVSRHFEGKRKRGCCLQRQFQILKENPLVIGIILVNFCTTFVASSMSSYIPALGMERGHSETAALLLITYNGAAGTIGRVIFGFLLDSKPLRSKRLLIYIMCAFLAGVTTVLTPLMSEYWWIAMCSAMGGAFIGTVFVQRTTVLVDQVGIKRMPVMFGLVQMINSIGFMLSTGLGGIMRDLLGTYIYYYYFAGSFCILMSITVLLCTVVKTTPVSQQ